MHDNAFLELSDVETAQKLSDRINPEDFHKVLDAFAKRCCPAPETLGLSYTWTVQQIERATDVMFKQPGDLEPLYDEIIRTAIQGRQLIGAKGPVKKSIYSLYQLFTIMKAANYRYLEFVSSFNNHSKGNKKLAKATESVVEKGRSYRGLNFFAERDLQVLEAIGQGEYMTFGIQGKDIRQHLENISASAMSRIFKRLRLHGIIERMQGTYKYSPQPMVKKSLPQDLPLETLCLYQH